jgi:hypothetical protein
MAGKSKIAKFFAENWSKSPKTVTIRLTQETRQWQRFLHLVDNVDGRGKRFQPRKNAFEGEHNERNNLTGDEKSKNWGPFDGTYKLLKI